MSPRAVAAVFDERLQAEVALSDLERGGVPPIAIGLAFPPDERDNEAATGKKDRLVPALPTTGFPGWTMGMAPWTITGVGPLVVQGTLSLSHPKERPADLHHLAAALGLREEAAEKIEAAFQRRGVLVTVEAPEKEPIATHILERNGGHILPRK